MSKISFYVGKEYLLYFFSCLTSTIIIFSTFVVLGEAKLLNQEGGWNLFLAKLFSSIPGMFETIIPITVLLATVLTLINLSRTSEITAMMAAGISLRQLIKPILYIGLLISAFYYFNQSYLTRWWGVENQVSLVSKSKSNNQWMFFQDKLYHFKDLNKKSKHIPSGKIIQFDNERHISQIQLFEDLFLEDGNWNSNKNQTYSFRGDGIVHANKQWRSRAENTFPVVFKPDLVSPKYSPIEAIVENIINRKQSGISYQDLLFAAYQKVASVLTIYIMILLALPFSIFSGRDSNVRTGIVISIVLGFIYWLLEQILVSLFSAEVFSAELAAFGTNILYLGIASYFIYTKTQ